MITSLSNIDYSNYWRLVQNLSQGGSGFVIGGMDGSCKWISPNITASTASSLVSNILENGLSRIRQNKTVVVQNDTCGVIAAGITAANDELCGVAIVFTRQNGVGTYTPSPILKTSLITICSLISKEVGLSNELSVIAVELGDRYEELNLLYGTEKETQHFDDQNKTINHLLEMTLMHLNVDAVTLQLPVKSINLTQIQAGSALNRSDLDHPIEVIMQQVMASSQPVSANDTFDGDSGELLEKIECKCQAMPLFDRKGCVNGTLIALNHNDSNNFTSSDRNLLEIMALRMRWIIESTEDELTGLLTRQAFERQLSRALDQSRASNITYALLYANIDRLHVINDVCGPIAGDAAITAIANVIGSKCGKQGIAARLGGDEFGVLIKNCKVDSATSVASDICATVAELPFEWDNDAYKLSVSIGVAQITKHTDNYDAGLGSAEIACAEAKELGGGRTRTLQRDDTVLLMRQDQMKWIGRIQTALDESQFKLFAQRINPFNRLDERLHHEVLIRLLDEDGKIISPDEFLPAAERYNLMPQIDRWVIDNSLKLLAQHWQMLMHTQQPHPLDNSTWAINLSGQSICDSRLTKYILERTAFYGLSPEIICFEVTESAAVHNISDARRFIASLKARGFKFSLDDFGTGASSFAYLKNLPVDYLKIDGSFVRPLLTDITSEAVVTAVHQVAKSLGLRTIAEFIETQEQSDKLQSIGVDYAQGYLIAVPKPLDGILQSYLPTLEQAPA